MPTVESNEAVASVAPVGEKERDRTVRECEVGMVDLRAKRYDEGAAEESDAADAADAGAYEYSLTDLSVEHEASVGWAGFHATCQAA